jgi:hypothetical protein
MVTGPMDKINPKTTDKKAKDEMKIFGIHPVSEKGP